MGKQQLPEPGWCSSTQSYELGVQAVINSSNNEKLLGAASAVTRSVCLLHKDCSPPIGNSLLCKLDNVLLLHTSDKRHLKNVIIGSGEVTQRYRVLAVIA